MKTRFARLWLLLFGIAVATVFFSVRLSREPEYQGKRLSVWFKQYYRTSQSNAEQHEEAAQALRAMGTSAVPFLLEAFYDYSSDTPLRTNVLTFLGELPGPLRFTPFVPAAVIHQEAARAIGEFKLPEASFLPLVTNRLYGPHRLERDATIYSN